MTKFVVKAFGYRIVASISTVLIAWIVTGSIQIGATVGIVEFVVKMLGYVVYEHIWHRYARSDN